MRALCIVIALAAGCGAQNSSTLHGALWLASNGLIVCDYGQTVWASHDGQWDRPGEVPGSTLQELNPVLGHKPTIGKLTAWAGIDIAANTAVLASRAPGWTKTAWLGIVAAVETALVVGHYNTEGICGMGR